MNDQSRFPKVNSSSIFFTDYVPPHTAKYCTRTFSKVACSNRGNIEIDPTGSFLVVDLFCTQFYIILLHPTQDSVVRSLYLSYVRFLLVYYCSVIVHHQGVPCCGLTVVFH